MNESSRRLNKLAEKIRAQTYLEIGVNTGDTFRDINIPYRTGVDPEFRFNTAELANEETQFFVMPSDEFFRRPSLPDYDVIFIDGLHKFEQVVRDFSNSVIRSHKRSAILLDDTFPSDVYSSLPDGAATNRHRAAAGGRGEAWHGDVYKTIFYIHDFWPSMDYCTIVGSGNPQTLVWRADGTGREPRFDSLERISRLTYFDLHDHVEVLNFVAEDEAIALFDARVE